MKAQPLRLVRPRVARVLIAGLFAALGTVATGVAGASAATISSVTPSNGPTAGNISITISGTDFDAAGNIVSINTEVCPTSEETTERIVCTLPEGTGADKPVQVTLGDGTPSNTVPFSYDAPSVSSITPANGATAGGYVVTLTGSNFGPPSAHSLRVVTFGPRFSSCRGDTSSHTFIECTAPEGEGATNDVTIAVDGQSSNATNFAYHAPAIIAVTPSQGSVAGGTRITIQGANFGLSAHATVDNNDCPLAEAQTHERIVCTTPPGSGIDVPVVVSAAGQTSIPSPFDYSDETCGNGIIDTAIGEVCDDGDNDDGDGCSAYCEGEIPQDKDQQRCIVATNKAAAKLTKFQGKDVAACAKAATKGDEPDPQTCVTADGKGNLRRTGAQIAATIQNGVRSRPDFGPTDAEAVTDAAIAIDLDLTHDIFGSDLNAAFIPGDDDRAKCQLNVLKAYEKLLAANIKTFGKCKQAGLKEGTILASSQLAPCVGAAQSEAKIRPGAIEIIGNKVDENCDGIVNPFPGCNPALDPVTCIVQRVDCRFCLGMDAQDNISETRDDDCDGRDDGLPNGSCE